jgi:hypothetical protein
MGKILNPQMADLLKNHLTPGTQSTPLMEVFKVTI